MTVSFPAQIRKGIIVPHPAYAGKVAVNFARFGDAEVYVSVEKLGKRRTIPQNRRMWKILEVFSALGWTKEEAKAWACEQFLEPIVREFPDGTRTETVRGTKHLNTTEMVQFMDEIERFLNEKRLWFPDAE